MTGAENPVQGLERMWTFVSSVVQEQPSRLVIQAKIVDWTFVNIVVEEPSFSVDREFVEEALGACRKTYGRGVPRFSQSIFLAVQSDGHFSVREQIDPLLLSALPRSSQVFTDLLDLPRTISSDQLTPLVTEGKFFLPNTRLVRYKGSNYVAKGPVYPSRVESEFLEVRNLLELPEQSPNIVPHPTALITVSETDTRLCGFLMRFYQNGNLDLYAQSLRAKRELESDKLHRWFQQLVDAVQFLAARETWHGDIKPDNILVDKNEDIVLTDFTRIFATFATASPEVRRHCLVASRSSPGYSAPFDDKGEGKLKTSGTSHAATPLGIPSGWSLDQVVASEVYSIGRTMYLLGEGISMIELYRTVGWVNHEHEFATMFSSESKTPACLRDLISRCTAFDAAERIKLRELQSCLKELHYVAKGQRTRTN